MQLAYNDPGSAYRLQNRISSLHRITLEGIIEKVLNEYSLPGKVIKISTLQLDLGSIADSDLEILLPVELERALRFELSQLMIRKDFDPLVEIALIPVDQNELEDWLFYLEKGTRRWTAVNADIDLALVFGKLNRADQQWLKERLLVLVGKPKVVDRILSDVGPALLPQLLALLAEGSVAEALEWIAQLHHKVASQLVGNWAKQQHKATISQQFIKAWASTGFTERTKERAKAATVQKVQTLLNVTLDAPLPEIDEQRKAPNRSATSALEVLKYLLFYGYWPAGQAPLQSEDASNVDVQPIDLGTYILQQLEKNNAEISSVIRQMLEYPTVRKRLVYQLKQEQLQAVMNSLSPAVSQAIRTYNDWIAVLQKIATTSIAKPGILQALWLELLANEQNLTASAVYETILAKLTQKLGTILPVSVIEVLLAQQQTAIRKADQTSTASISLPSDEVQTFSKLLLQQLQQQGKVVKVGDEWVLANTTAPADEPEPYASVFEKDRVEGLDKEVKASATAEGETPNQTAKEESENEALAAAQRKEVAKNKQQQLNEKELTEAFDKGKQAKQGAEQDIEDSLTKDSQMDDEALSPEDADETVVPKNQLQSFLYFLRSGVWPQVPVNADGSMSTETGIALPEKVLLALLKESPLAVMSELFPLLVNFRVRERLAYQLSHEAMQDVITTFATIHAPIKRFNEFYLQLLPLALAMNKANTGEAIILLPEAEATLKTFMLWLLYEEPSIKSFEAFLTHFLVFWQERGNVPLETFGATIQASFAAEKMPTALVENVSRTLAAYIAVNTPASERDPAEIEAESQEQIVQAMLLMDDYETPDAGDNNEEPPVQGGKQTDAARDQENEARNTAAQLKTNGNNIESDGNAAGARDLVTEALLIANRNAEARNREMLYKDSTQNAEGIDSSNETTNQKVADDNNEPISAKEQGLIADSTHPEELENIDPLENKKVDAEAKGSISEVDGEARVADVAAAIINSDIVNENKLAPNDEPYEEEIMEYPLSPASNMPFVDSQLLMEAAETAEDELEIEHKTLKQKIEQINNKLIPERLKQAKVLRPQDPFNREQPEAPLEEPVFIENSGIVLLWPFIGRCFTMLGYTEKGLFKNMAMANRAVHLLQYMATGEEQTPEYHLVLNKLLCGIPVFEAVERDVILTAQEKEEADVLLRAVIGNWEKMKKLSIPSFRESFLKRSGRLIESETSWTLRVDQQSFDMLLDTLPWTIGMIKLRYMEKVLYVEWR
jgi:hypothetical protein